MAGISTSSSQSAPHRDGILSKGGAGGEARQEPLPLFTPAAAHLVRDRIVWRSERGQLDRRATRMGVLTVGARGSVRGGRSDWGVQRPRPSKLERARAICACALFARSRCAGSVLRVDSLVLLSLFAALAARLCSRPVHFSTMWKLHTCVPTHRYPFVLSLGVYAPKSRKRETADNKNRTSLQHAHTWRLATQLHHTFVAEAASWV